MNRMVSLFLIVFFIACEVKPQEITYGQDACHFCKMTIVDRQHAAQLVTAKGKAFKYDAIECMMNHLNKWDGPDVKFYLVADYANPGMLTDATQAHYLISQSIPSPMGEFLTAFGNPKDRENVTSESDQMLNWDKLKIEFELPN